jgi:2-polyprenyl-3-methyl-5-hydroxy-6-metoxy-1,4-benzoquinol methylase
MAINATHRTSVISALLPKLSERLMDVGCGPITAAYPYAEKAVLVTCIDWKLRVFGSIPSNIECLDGDFTEIELAKSCYDAIIVADVFEHVSLERESLFVKKCVSVLKPGGHIVVSVPHQGTFAYLDPYRVKPAIHRLLWRLGLYNSVHNGSCDIRKGHKHYTVQELIEKFKPLQLLQVVYFGYFFDTLLSWAVALSRGSGQFPGYTWLEQAYRRELERDYGQRSFNVALKFYKPTDVAK